MTPPAVSEDPSRQTDSDAAPTRVLRIFDTTLRDGEQSPGASLNVDEKVKIAHQLQSLGVDIIEAGFPITSQGDFDAVRRIGAELTDPVVCGLARCVDADIDRAAEALEGADKPRIHVFCATSKIHLEHKFRKPFEQIVDMARRGVERARKHVDNVEFSPEDGSRTGIDELETITRVAVEAGATTVNIPDTVGYATPAEYGAIFSELRRRIPELDRDGVVLSSHCHNDLGLAVANSLAAAMHGAGQVECTVNGIGERAGNAALEEIVMALRTRADAYAGLATAIRVKELYRTSRMVSNLTGLSVQRNKAVIGANAFAHEAGIHQDGVLKNRDTYEIMDPRDIGVPESQLVLGKHSGRHALADRVKGLGYTVDDTQLEKVYERFKALADRKKDVYDEDIEALVDQELDAEASQWGLGPFKVTSGSDETALALVELVDSSGERRREAAYGDGPIDACFTAIQMITGIVATLEDYSTRAVTRGKDAQGEAQVVLIHHGRTVRGRGVSTDVIEAAVLAYLSAMNRIRTAEARKVAATTLDGPGVDAEAELGQAAQNGAAQDPPAPGTGP
ncbi:MAG: 2-isopropylmalate synthase [Planctomycetota bacterium]